MASCAACNKTILFGGEREGELRYCSKDCRAADAVGRAAALVPADAVRDAAGQIRRGACPACGRRQGPVDLHRSHRVYSALVYTQWQSRVLVACRPCARKALLSDALFSLVLGWWGVPWGLLATPVQIGRNVAALLAPERAANAPSPPLEAHVRRLLAAQALSSGAAPRAGVRA